MAMASPRFEGQMAAMHHSLEARIGSGSEATPLMESLCHEAAGLENHAVVQVAPVTEAL